MNQPGSFAEDSDVAVDGPFCRSEELAAITKDLMNEGCWAVFLSSDTGLGASTILRKLTAAEQGSVPVLNLHGSTSLTNIAYGVMSAYVGIAEILHENSRVHVLRSFVAEFQRLSERLEHGYLDPKRVPLIVVNDGHCLDHDTAELLALLAMTGTAKLIVSYSQRHLLPEQLRKLWFFGIAETISLVPLDQNAGHRFCSELVAGKVLPATSWHYWSLAAGTPLLMNLLLTHDKRRGKLHRHLGSWVVEEGSSDYGEDLQDAIGSALLGLSSEGRDALNLLALSEPVEESVFQQMVSEVVIKELYDWRLLQHTHSAPPALGFFTPIFGEVIRALIPATQSRKLYQQLLGFIDGEPKNNESLLRLVLWALETEVPISERLILRAAVFACKLYQSDTALKLADRIFDEKYALRVSMVKARAKYNLGEYQEALHLLGERLEAVATLEDLLFGSLLKAATRLALGMGAAAVSRDAENLRNAGARLANPRVLDAEKTLAQAQDIAALVDLMAMSCTGEYSKMADLSDTLIRHRGTATGFSGLSRAMAMAMDSERLTAQGLPLKGLARAMAAYAIENDEGSDVFFLPESIMQRQFIAILCAGDWKLAAEILKQFSLDAGPLMSSLGGSANVIRGMVLMRSGHLRQALASLTTGIEALRISDPLQLQGFCTAMTAYVSARLGQVVEARQLLDEHVESSGMFIVLAHERAYAAATRYTLESHHILPAQHVGVTALLQQANQAHTEGSFMIELNALALLFELGEPNLNHRISVLAAAVEGPWALGLGQYADALDRQSGADLLLAAETLERSGMFAFAKLALDEAEKLLKLQGADLAANTARAWLQRVSTELADENHSSSDRPGHTPLTRREREIANMAAAGHSDRIIADMLKLSLRTVEGHLYRTYGKLGIAGRDELKAAMAVG
ncbi:helix-turn-helix transcriptional regulator [Arthrobacter psychrochitiniphilus]|uniref:helix-turn-helix transcriptional regulator n=1 Tax=Arthrobacter psychrochitiniphilus TaxID=291045 RepID=UPI003F7C96D3